MVRKPGVHWPSELGLKMPAYTKSVLSHSKEVLLATLKLTKLYIRSTNSHFLKQEVKSKQKHLSCKKRSKCLSLEWHDP